MLDVIGNWYCPPGMGGIVACVERAIFEQGLCVHCGETCADVVIFSSIAC